MKKTRLSSVVRLLAAGMLMGGCMADFGGESPGGAAQGPSIGGGEAIGEAKQALIAGTWSDWQPLGGATLKGPTIASRGVGRLDAFVLGLDNNVYIKNYANGAWSPWQSLGAPAGVTLVSSPDAVSSDASSVSVVARANDSKFYLRTWTATSGWSGWNSLPGEFSNQGPGISSRGPGSLDVFGSGLDNQTWQTFLGGGSWNCCGALGSPQNAPLASNVTSVSWNSSAVHLFVRGADNSLWSRWWDGATWYPTWYNLGGQFTSGLGVASWAPGHLDVFGVGTDSQIWQRQYDAGWSGFTPVGFPPGGLAAGSSPDAVSSGPGRIDLIVRGSDNQPWVRSFTSFTARGMRPPVAAGQRHSLAVKSDGTVWAWGYNRNGQLGDGTTTDRSTPGPVPNLTDVVSVAASDRHNLALKSDGTLWAWGDNIQGQLGDGTTTESLTPKQVPGLTDVVAVTAGNSHNLALKRDGTLWAWGQNSNGQLGDGTTTPSLTPKQVLTGVVSVAAGSSHTLASKSDGTLWAWGENANSELGDGTTTDSLTPKQVPNLTGVVSVAVGLSHSLALKSDGTLWAWGDNYSGQLGDGTTFPFTRTTPQLVNLPGGVVAMGASPTHSMVVKSDGTLWTWGLGSELLGDGTTSRSTPGQLTGLPVRL